MDIFAIRVFVQVADIGSLVGAGRALGLSASGVGKSITRIEESLGARLFNRNTRSINLTEEGDNFLRRARRILVEFDAAQAELTENVSFPKGRLRIGLPMIGDPFLAPLAQFQQLYPDVQLDLDFDNRNVDVVDEGFDAVIRSGNLEDSRLSSRLLGSFRMLVVCAPAYIERCGQPICPADLAMHECIQFRMPNSGKLQMWQLRRDINEPEPQLSTKMTCNTNEARLSFALAGLGLAYMSDFSVREALVTGTLVTVLDEYTTQLNTFRLLWPSGKHLTPKLRAFIDFVSEHVSLLKANGQERKAAAILSKD